MARALHVDRLVGLRADLAVDARAVRDRVAALEGGSERPGIDDVAGDDADPRGVTDATRERPVVAPARECDDVVALGTERHRQVAPDEARAAGDRDAHDAVTCAASPTGGR